MKLIQPQVTVWCERSQKVVFMAQETLASPMGGHLSFTSTLFFFFFYVYTESLFISDHIYHIFRNIQPWVTSYVKSSKSTSWNLGSSFWLFRTLFLQAPFSSQSQLFPLQSCTFAESLFLLIFTLSRYLQPWVSVPLWCNSVLAFSIQENLWYRQSTRQGYFPGI